MKSSCARQRVNPRQIVIAMIGYVFLSATTTFGAVENLDQIDVRKTRITTSAWGPTLLENALNNYIWQPETLSYFDSLTGKEVWILTHAPDQSEYTSKEHGVNAWSFDGSRVGFFSLTRLSNNPTLKADYHFRWIVNTDGSGLRMCEGYGRRSIPLDGFGWAHTENAYYTPGSGAGDATADSTAAKIYRNVVGNNNSVSGNLVFDTSSINTFNKDLVKDGVAQDDKMIVLRDTVTHDAGPPNVTATTEMYFIDIKSNPATATHWGIARGIGPAADPYGTHTLSDELRWHDVWAPGPSPKWIMGDYTGNSDIFVTMDRNGTASDGGPRWTDWDGSKFGEIRVEGNGTGGVPNNPYNMPYFGHPAFDRWGRYALMGTYTDPQSSAGTRIWDSATHSLLSNYMMKGKYDGQHHSWTGWADHVAMVDPLDLVIYGNKYNGNETTRYPIVDTHYPGNSGNYMGYPRPSQSPDGTKVQYHLDWLNNNGDAYPSIAWAVAYYPYPPEIISAAKNGNNVRLTWDFNQGTPENPNFTSPRTYATRGWPNESTDRPPSPREIKQFRVWSSTDNSVWTPLGAVDYINAGGAWTETSWTYDIAQTNGTTRYYAVTSLEHSGLESRSLSNVWMVTLDNYGSIIENSQFAAYPSDPGGINGFHKVAPNAPQNISALYKQAPAVADGQYTVRWNAPADAALIRYYNIYAEDGSLPSPVQQNRIASIPASSDYGGTGSFKYIDWSGNIDGSTNYLVTSVDYQGNESINKAESTSDSTPPTVSITSPTSGSITNAVKTITVSADDDFGVTRVEYYLSNVLLATVTTTPFSYNWDTTSVADGEYTLSAKAYDAAGNVGQSSGVLVTVKNTRTVVEPIAPTVTIKKPTSGSKIGNIFTVSASATSAVGVKMMQVYVDNALRFTTYSKSFTTFMSTYSMAKGSHVILVKAIDNAGTVGQKSVTVYR